MRAAVERVLGTLRDKEVPAKQVIAAKLEMLESNSPTAVLLTEVASVEDAEVESFEAKIDPVTNTLKIKSGKHSVAAPSTPEDLRLRHRRIGLAWDMLATKHSNRAWLSPNMNDCMRRFSDFILGTQVAGLVAGSRVPSWSLVLAFEHECRKAVCKWLRDGKVNTLADGYEKALSDVELLNRYFVIPFSLNTKETGWAASNVPPPPTLGDGPGRPRKGGGKGKTRIKIPPRRPRASLPRLQMARPSVGSSIAVAVARIRTVVSCILSALPRETSSLQLQACQAAGGRRDHARSSTGLTPDDG